MVYVQHVSAGSTAALHKRGGKAATKSAHAQDSTRYVVVFGFHLDPAREVFQVPASIRQHGHQQAASLRLQGGYLGRLQHQRVGQGNLLRQRDLSRQNQILHT